MGSNGVCDMRGYLSFLILWIVSKKPASGAQIARELEKRKGCKPNPGTIYPALKELVGKKAIVAAPKGGKEKVYSITPLGRSQMESARTSFCKTFYDVFSR
jgi:DNA-binding PadR family transcriptional regulator